MTGQDEVEGVSNLSSFIKNGVCLLDEHFTISLRPTGLFWTWRIFRFQFSFSLLLPPLNNTVQIYFQGILRVEIQNLVSDQLTSSGTRIDISTRGYKSCNLISSDIIFVTWMCFTVATILSLFWSLSIFWSDWFVSLQTILVRIPVRFIIPRLYMPTKFYFLCFILFLVFLHFWNDLFEVLFGPFCDGCILD